MAERAAWRAEVRRRVRCCGRGSRSRGPRLRRRTGTGWRGRAGKDLYHELLQPACADCHGERGAGNGLLASRFDPRPRNFACRQTAIGIPDGQLHWIIENGSPAAAMPSFGFLSEEKIRQLVLSLRSLANDH